ncbi:sugar porter family MFS transporter [Arthrobacter sp.]|uniref:sugar porter family MFS transporter n=1 Tax=Arthrobacter sp. TaxID=1667 RepID=UPI003A94A03E
MSAIIEHDSTPTKVVMVSIVAALGGFLFGFDSAVINGAVDAIAAQFGLSGVVLGFTVSCALLGAMIGAWFAGPFADKQGRVRAMLVAAALFTISAAGSGFAFSAVDLIIWRFIGGLGVGMASVLAPAYIAEVAPAHSRGRLASLQQMAIVLGIFVALLSDAFIATSSGGATEQGWLGLSAWRWMFLTGIVPAVIYGVLAWQIPESPRYLVARGQLAKAAKVLHEVVGLKSRDEVDEKIASIKSTISTEKNQGLRNLVGGKGWLLPIVWVGILLSVFQQFVGINVIFYYSTSLWLSVGFTESDSFTITVITSVTNILVTIIAIALVDKIGRKPLLLWGSAGMTIALGVMAVAFSQANGSGDQVSLPQPWGVIALIAANVFVVAFGATWGPVVWVLLGEMFSNKMRAVALSVAAAAQWLANFLITTTFPTLSEISLVLAYGLYALFALLSFFFVFRFVQETKGRELESMQ